jgi:CO/xanthine dehydrogenase FAD-binding subunit
MMWTSIQQVLKPQDLQEALVLQEPADAVLFAGGSYLVGEKDSSIHTLVDISHLLDDTVTEDDHTLKLGAGITLQTLLVQAPVESLRNAVKAACPSKNIRNQRTLGGEIARGRTDSDLLVYLHAAGALLEIHHQQVPVPLDSWDGRGVIVEVRIPATQVSLERVALLDSAPAFVIAAVGRSGDSIVLAAGGQASRIISNHLSAPVQEDAVRAWLETVESIYSDDHLGTKSYKRQLVANLVSAMAVIL